MVWGRQLHHGLREMKCLVWDKTLASWAGMLWLSFFFVEAPYCFVFCLSPVQSTSKKLHYLCGSWVLRAKTEITVTRRFLSWAKEAKEWRSKCNCQWALLANISLSSLLHCPLSISSTISEALAATCSHMAELGQCSHPPQHATFAGSVYSLSPMPKSTTFAACCCLHCPDPAPVAGFSF